MIRNASSINLIMLLSLTIHHLQVITPIIMKHITPESYVCVSHYQCIINTRKINTRICFLVPLKLAVRQHLVYVAKLYV